MHIRALVIASALALAGCRSVVGTSEAVPVDDACGLTTPSDVADHLGWNLDPAAREAGLTPLAADSLLPDGVREVRVWCGRSFDPVQRLLRVRAEGDSVGGDVVLLWHVDVEGRAAFGPTGLAEERDGLRFQPMRRAAGVARADDAARPT